MKVNSTQVAKLAGVSRSTVSRVINNNPNVNQETRERVLKIIEESKYTPNTNAQSLAGKKNDVIGLFIFDQYNEEFNTKEIYFDYYMNFITTITREAFIHKKQVLIDIVDGEEAEARLKGFFHNGNISSGIFIGPERNNKFIDEFIKEDHPIALIDYSNDPSIITDNIKLINTNDYEGGYKATMELIESGAKNIIHIEGNREKLSSIERKKGYLKALKDSGITLKKEFIVEGDYLESKAYKGIKGLIEGDIEFDGIFCASDTMALGALKALKGYSNKEIPIWGFDNLRASVPLGIKSVDPQLEKTAVEAIRSIMGICNKDIIKYTDIKLISGLESYLNI